MTKITWLASYPKSGNTWMRVLLTNLQADRAVPADINALDIRTIASCRILIDEALGFPSADMTSQEIESHRPEVYRHVARAARERLFLKIHDAYAATRGAPPIVPADISQGAVCIVRNPLDIAVSLVHQVDGDLNVIIRRMADSAQMANDGRAIFHTQVPYRVGTWSDHVAGWLDQDAIPVHLVRYEDMVWRPHETFEAVAGFVGLAVEPHRIARAIEFSAFEALQAQEREKGFAERLPVSTRFFRKGQVGSWREELSAAQVERIIGDHGAMMRRLGYLTCEGALVDCCPLSRAARKSR